MELGSIERLGQLRLENNNLTGEDGTIRNGQTVSYRDILSLWLFQEHVEELGRLSTSIRVWTNFSPGLQFSRQNIFFRAPR